MKLNVMMAGLLGSVALLAVTTANAADLIFPKGSGDFSWDLSLQKFADAHKDLAGQKLTIWDSLERAG